MIAAAGGSVLRGRVSTVLGGVLAGLWGDPGVCFALSGQIWQRPRSNRDGSGWQRPVWQMGWRTEADGGVDCVGVMCMVCSLVQLLRLCPPRSLRSRVCDECMTVMFDRRDSRGKCRVANNTQVSQAWSPSRAAH
jgi:hypothetical protein